MKAYLILLFFVCARFNQQFSVNVSISSVQFSYRIYVSRSLIISKHLHAAPCVKILKSEARVAEDILDCIVCSREVQFSDVA